MRTTFFCGALSCAALLFATEVAFAQDALKVEVIPKALKGQGLPAIVVIAEVPLARVELSLKRSTDRKRIKLDAGPIGAGRKHNFELPMKRVGSAQFSGTLSVEMKDGQSGQMPLNVDVELLAPLKLKIARSDIDLKKKRMKLSADRDVKKVQISVMSDTGTPLGTTVKEWGGNVMPGGDAFDVKWKQKKGTVMRITVQAWDADGFFGALELFPWQVDIPHEEVNFATGSFDIDDSESEKLDGSLKKINGAIAKYGSLAKIRLFIGGHTDTVGDAGSNRVLSNNRARSIGRWFRKQGIKIPILYAGFGEDRLAVDTADNTDEAKNRRAEYIVAVDAPALIGGIRWNPL